MPKIKPFLKSYVHKKGEETGIQPRCCQQNLLIQWFLLYPYVAEVITGGGEVIGRLLLDDGG